MTPGEGLDLRSALGSSQKCYSGLIELVKLGHLRHRGMGESTQVFHPPLNVARATTPDVSRLLLKRRAV